MPQLKRRANAFLILMIMALFVLIAVMILIMTPARAADLPEGVSCEQVRSLVAEHGKVKAIAWAIEHGLSIRQIYLIRKTCKV